MATRFEYYLEGSGHDAAFYGVRWRGQVFSPQQTHTITSVKLQLRRAGLPGTVTVSIRKTYLLSGLWRPTGEDLCSGTINGNGLTETVGGALYEISLGAGAVLGVVSEGKPYIWIEGTKFCYLGTGCPYAIVVRAPSGNSSNWIAWSRNSWGTYEGGTDVWSVNSGVGWGATADPDQLFEEWGTVGGSNPNKVGFEGTTTGDSGIPGYLWVEGTYLHYVDANGDERRKPGTKEGATGKDLGQIWIESTKLRYIDSSGDERYIEGSVV